MRWILLTCAALMVAGPATPVTAAEASAAILATGNNSALRNLKKKITFNYQVLGAGFALVQARFTIVFNKGAYRASSLIQPRGVGHMIARGRFASTATGRILSDGLQPLSYRSAGKTRKKTYNIRLNWSGNSRPRIKATPKLPPPRGRAVQRALRPSMHDPLSTLLANTLFQSRRPCSRKRQIFDGRTIWELRFRYIGLETLKKGMAGDYIGPAYKCLVKYAPVAGQSARILRLERQRPIPYVPMWLAPVYVDGATLLVPVKITFPTKWAKATVLLTRTRINGQPVALTAK